MGSLLSTKCSSNNRLDGKVAVITGANTGIGKETAKDFYRRGATVILACRNLEKANEAMDDIKKNFTHSTNLGEIRIVELDLSSLESVRACAKQLLDTEEEINILINNAGIMMSPYNKTKDGFELHFATNYLGHFLLTILLLPKICRCAPARIINVSSVLHWIFGGIDYSDVHFDKRKYLALHAYQQSKLANILFTKELAKRLSENNITGVNVYCLHPGIIRTELSRHLNSIFPGLTWIYDSFGAIFFKNSLQGAQTQIYCAVSDECAHETGLYYSECRPTCCSSSARDSESAEKLWHISLKSVGFDPNTNVFQI
ncbi:retinol dehydrogenase 12-like [Diorhabda sublineata]|uniref:retinol dehydrogenase 12-like n=1 Tax=Diorhabda sublineata TaxID=1163346 RepID=UPI0024E15922|nr:retinol dehydrogenase 12-like [Diorhabda sublineata]